jgi:hypothetical protein
MSAGYMKSAAYTPSGVVEFGQEANRPGDATNAPGHDTEEVTSMPDKRNTVKVCDPQGVVRFETDDMQIAMAKASKLAAPNLASGTPRWYEAGWRVKSDA